MTEKPEALRELLQKYVGKEEADIDFNELRAELSGAFGHAIEGECNVYNAPENNHFVSRKSDGSFEILDEQKLAEMLQASAAGTGPKVFITANHAFLETLADIDTTLDGYSELMQVCTGKRDEGAKKFVGGVTPSPIDEAGDDHSKVVMVCALNTDKNNYLNLHNLFSRLCELEAHKDAPQEDRFEHVSPIAKSMVKTLLLATVEDPSRVELDDSQHPPRFIKGDAPVKLREDACDIMRQSMFFAFSKGGNDFRDGIRLLVRTLHSEPGFKMEKGDLHDIVENLCVTVQSMNEKPMAPYYQEKGASVTYFTNRHDKIALPPEISYSSKNDPAVVYDGPEGAMAHQPGVITESLFAHPYIMQHNRTALASLNELPAIRFAMYDKVNGHHGLVLKTATSTSDKMMEKAIPEIEKAFAEHGIGHMSVKRIDGREGTMRYELESKLGVDNLLSRPTLLKLIDSFDALRKDENNHVVVSSSVEYPSLSTLSKDVAGAKYRCLDGEDWKDSLKVTGAQVYDRNMQSLNDLIKDGGENNYLPTRVDMPFEEGGISRA